METEDQEASPQCILDEESGSAYEESNSEQLSSQNEEEEFQVSRPCNGGESASVRGRRQSRGRNARDPSPYRRSPKLHSPKSRDSSISSDQEERHRAASKWAATFQAPGSPTDIKTPPRRLPPRSKRKAVKPASEIRAKRLKSWYNSEYRDLLNVDIKDAVARFTDEYKEPAKASQVGCSVWTVEEKDFFFSALSRLGRDDVRGIASRIETKSEIEVQEYIQLLHEALMATSSKLLGITDLPAAIEISEECCSVLERAGDALAIRQERAEEDSELSKWDDLWLLNSEVSGLLQRENDRKEVEECLSAVNLFVLGNWLELSRRIFMNSNNEEENWENFTESEETPAIRATAFEDFHSLAVSVTKRLISATLFCTMSRQRAMASNLTKHADVNEDDVEAAVRILGLKLDSRDFWIGCARRCNLRVFDEEWSSFMSYEEAEKSLQEMRERSRSRSVSRRARSVSRAQPEAPPEDQPESESVSEDYGSEDDSEARHESVISDQELTDYLTETEVTASKTRKDRLLERAKTKLETERAHEKYVEAFDNAQSRTEEQRLWALLGQTAPFEIKTEPMDLSNPPKGNFRDDTEQANWRNFLESRSQWETFETPVPTASFDSNRNTSSKRGSRRSTERAYGGRNDVSGSRDDEELGWVEDSDEEGDPALRYVQDDLEEQQDRQEEEEEDHEDYEDETNFSNLEDMEAAAVDSHEGDVWDENAQDGVESQGEDEDDDIDDAQSYKNLKKAQLDMGSRIKYPSSVSNSRSEEVRVKKEYDNSE